MLAVAPETAPLVGRDEEFAVAGRQLAHIHDECGRLLVIRGEAGLGKTRLVEKLRELCLMQDIPVLLGHCSGQNAEAFHPIREALERHFEISQRDPVPKRQSKIERSLRRAAPHLLQTVPFVGAFLAHFGEELVLSSERPGGSGVSIYGSIARVLGGLAERKGLCLIVEDLHQGDPDTVHFINFLAQAPSMAQRILISITLRPSEATETLADFVLQWIQKGCAHMDLRELDEEHLEVLTQHLLGVSELPPQARAQLRHFTGGNPFILGELLRYLDASGTLESGRETGTLATLPTALPERVEAMIDQRLSRLGEDALLLTQGLAVLGVECDLEDICSVTHLGEDDALRALDQACGAGILREREDGRVMFVHEIGRCAVYSYIGSNRRRRFHDRAATLFRERGRPGIAAHHLESVGRDAEMATACLEAARVAESLGGFETALDWYHKAMPFSHVAATAPGIVRCLLVLGRWQEAEEWLAVLDEEDPTALLLRADLEFLRGDFPVAENAARLAMGARTKEERSEAAFRLAEILLYQGRFSEGEEQARAGLERARGSTDQEQVARWTNILGEFALFRGQLDDATSCFREAIRACPTEGSPLLRAAIQTNMGLVMATKGHYSAALQLHTSALAISEGAGDVRGVIRSLHARGKDLIAAGRLDEAAEELEKARLLAGGIGEAVALAKIVHSLGDVAVSQGNMDDADAYFRQAHREFTTRQVPYDVAHSLLSAAQANALAGREREAILARSDARGLVETRGFGLLHLLFPSLGAPAEERIRAGLVAYAAGDALGVPWEGKHPDEIPVEAVKELPDLRGWGVGSTSDDTALTLLVAGHLVEEQGPGSQRSFLDKLAARQDEIPGIGPSTYAALDRYARFRTLRAERGNTNGAAMRALPVGWALPPSNEPLRRAWVRLLSETTHGGPEALVGAAVVAAVGAWAIEGASPSLLAEIALTESRALELEIGAEAAVSMTLSEVAAGSWSPLHGGVGMDVPSTLAAVFHCVMATEDLEGALFKAVTMGGDTDTVAALVGGILGCQATKVPRQLRWLHRVRLPSDQALRQIARGLSELRYADWAKS